MGVNGLFKFLRDTCPDVFEEIHISEYAYKKVAIDIGLYIYLLKARHHSTRPFNDPKPFNAKGWLALFIQLIKCLRENELHCLFVYDGKFPPDKDAERKERADARAKREEQLYRIEEAIERFHETSEIDPILIEFQQKKRNKPKRLLGKNKNVIDIKFIEFCVHKMRNQIFQVTEGDFELTRELFDILDVPYVKAPMEAETMCADLCKRGLVDAALSRDSDVLAYGSPIFLTNLDSNTGVCFRITYTSILEELDYTSDQFLDFCIMCGTDYNKNIFRVGPKTAYNLILSHGSIENIEENTKRDTSILRHNRVRELFRDYEQVDMSVPYCGAPDFKSLAIFVSKRNLYIPVESLKKAFMHNTVIFEDNTDDEEIIVEDSDDEEEILFDASDFAVIKT